jgi:type IV pilus assembly protein PilX
MRATRTPRRHALRQRQQGVVMLVALIVLVAMALAALSLIRSVDTTTAVVGNLGFRQASILPANVAVEEAVAALFEKNTIADKTVDKKSENYYATKQVGEDTRGVPKDLQTRGSFPLDKTIKPDTDNTVAYVIERMCEKNQIADATHCDMMPPKLGAGTTVGDASFTLPTIPFYRLTIRVEGPRNTTSFVQVMLR